MVLVHDEYGRFQGLVTAVGVLEAIAGVFQADSDGLGAVRRDDGLRFGGVDQATLHATLLHPLVAQEHAADVCYVLTVAELVAEMATL